MSPARRGCREHGGEAGGHRAHVRAGGGGPPEWTTRGPGARQARDRVQSPDFQPQQLGATYSPSAKWGRQGPTLGSREDKDPGPSTAAGRTPVTGTTVPPRPRHLTEHPPRTATCHTRSMSLWESPPRAGTLGGRVEFRTASPGLRLVHDTAESAACVPPGRSPRRPLPGARGPRTTRHTRQEPHRGRFLGPESSAA